MRIVVTERHPEYGTDEQMIYQGSDWDHATLALCQHLTDTATDEYGSMVLAWWNETGKPLSKAGLNPSFPIKNGTGRDIWQAWPDDVVTAGPFEVLPSMAD